jgi:hypothetical protein
MPGIMVGITSGIGKTSATNIITLDRVPPLAQHRLESLKTVFIPRYRVHAIFRAS